jgi:hypothetical protein
VVLRLNHSSYLVGACTGRSADFSPFRMGRYSRRWCIRLRGYRKLSDFVAAAKAKPGSINYASATIASLPH